MDSKFILSLVHVLINKKAHKYNYNNTMIVKQYKYFIHKINIKNRELNEVCMFFMIENGPGWLKYSAYHR